MALITVTFEWDDKNGLCYDCDRPAGFFAGCYAGAPRVCAVCAANRAADGDTIERIDKEDDADHVLPGWPREEMFKRYSGS